MINLIKKFFGLEKTEDQIYFESMIEKILLNKSYTIDQILGGSITFTGNLDNKVIEFRNSSQRGDYCVLSVANNEYDCLHLMTLKATRMIGSSVLKQREDIDKINREKTQLSQSRLSSIIK
jgi:hypothetical protein